MVTEIWDQIPEHYAGADIGEFVVMPNHIHGIIFIVDVGADPRVRPIPGGQSQGIGGQSQGIGGQLQGIGGQLQGIGGQLQGIEGQSQGIAPTLPNVIQRFKTLTTKRYIVGANHLGWRPFDGKLWQRNYYERVIRTEKELNQVRQYIIDNPANWVSDEDNPDVKIQPV